MKLVVLFILFIGIFVILQGYYIKKINELEKTKIITKYVPISIFEGRMSGIELIDNQFKSQFEKITSSIE